MRRIWITDLIDRTHNPPRKVGKSIRSLQLKALSPKSCYSLVCCILNGGFRIASHSLVLEWLFDFSFDKSRMQNYLCHTLV